MQVAYGCAVAGGVVGVVVVLMLKARSSSMSLVEGSAFGVIMGLLNTSFCVAEHFKAPMYMSLTLSLATGIVVFSFMFFVVATCARESRGKLALVTFCTIGAYLLVKSVGFAVGNYPDEWNMKGNEWRDYVYVGSTFGAIIMGVVVQWSHVSGDSSGYDNMNEDRGGSDSGACCSSCCPGSSGASGYDEFEEVRTYRRVESARGEGDVSPDRSGSAAGPSDYIEDAPYMPPAATPTYSTLASGGAPFYADSGDRYYADYSE